MCFKGTPRRSADDVNREFDEIGAHYNAFTSEECTVYYASVLPEYQEASIDILADIMRLKLRKIAGRLRDSHKMSLVLDEKMIDVITRRCTEVETGARNIDHIITQTLLPMLSSALLERMASGPLPGAVRMTVAEDESFQVEFIEAETKGA